MFDHFGAYLNHFLPFWTFIDLFPRFFMVFQMFLYVFHLVLNKDINDILEYV